MNNTTALDRIIQERERQQAQEGYTLTHDDEHEVGQLAILAAYYTILSIYPTWRSIRPPEWAILTISTLSRILDVFGWQKNSKGPIRDLERAGALILAELERRLRKEKP